MPEVLIGWITDAGSTYYLPRKCNGDKHIGLYLALTGKSVIGEDCEKFGIATHTIDHC